MTASYSALAHFDDYWPPDYGWGDRDPRHDSTLLVEFWHSGVHFGLMHVDAVAAFTALLDELVPLIPGGLVAGTCGCYNPDSVTGSGSRSFHTWGIAIDVNWLANPMNIATLPPGEHVIPHAEASRIATKYGIEYGGDWTSPKDLMHFEIHLTPAAARAVTPIREDWLAMATKEEVQEAVTAAVDAYFASSKGVKRLQEIVWSQVRRPFLPYTGAPVPWRALSIARLAARQGPLKFDPKMPVQK